MNNYLVVFCITSHLTNDESKIYHFYDNSEHSYTEYLFTNDKNQIIEKATEFRLLYNRQKIAIVIANSIDDFRDIDLNNLDENYIDDFSLITKDELFKIEEFNSHYLNAKEELRKQKEEEEKKKKEEYEIRRLNERMELYKKLKVEFGD